MQYMNYTTVHAYPPVYSTTKQAENLGLVMSVGVLALALGGFVLLWKLSECWKSYYISRIAQLYTKMKASEKLKVQEKMALQAAQIEGGDPSSEHESTPDKCKSDSPILEQDPPPPPPRPHSDASATRGRSSTYAGTSSHSEELSEQALPRGRVRSSTYAGVSRPWPWPNQEEVEIRRHVQQGEEEIEMRTQEQEQQKSLKQGSRMRSSTYAGPSHTQQHDLGQTLQGRVRSRTYAGGTSQYLLQPPPPHAELESQACCHQQLQQQQGSRLRSSTYTLGESPLQLEELEDRRPRRSTFAGEGSSQQRVRWNSFREILQPEFSTEYPRNDPRLNEYDDAVIEEERVDEIVPQSPPPSSENRRSADYRPRSSTLAYGEGFQSHQLKPWPPSTQQHQSPSSSAAETYNRPSQNRDVAVAAPAVNSQPQSRSRDDDIDGEFSKQQ